MMSPRRTFSFARLLRHGRTEVRRSLQARTIVLVVLVTLVVAVVFSLVAMVFVRSSQLDQVTEQSRNDFSQMAQQAQSNLDSADVSGQVQYQRLVNDLASQLQGDGASNLAGVYLWGKGASNDAIVPVSTEPTYAGLVTDAMRSSVASDTEGSVFIQSVDLGSSDGERPGAVLGTALDFGAAGDLELFALYSYDSQQQALTRIQLNLLSVCLALSAAMGVLMWVVLRGIVRPVERVAEAAETLADGDLDARVQVDRNDELGTLQRSFNSMADSLNQKIGELEEAGAMQRRFVSDVSHELRTPVTTMRMASDLLDMRKDGFDPSTRRTVELLGGQIGRFQDMLADLLEISRYDAGYAALDLVEADVRDSIREAVDQTAALADSRRVPVHVYLPNVQVLARIDPRRIVRIVRNLVANAVDFAEDWPIEVRLAANRRAVVISVRDHGVGMDPDQVPHVFDRFWRGDPSRARTSGGTGLGLSIAITDARLHNGTIEVRSEPDEGAWFLVSLPRNPETGEVPASDMPVAFEPGTDAMRIVGGFGVADNGAVDYLDSRQGGGAA